MITLNGQKNVIFLQDENDFLVLFIIMFYLISITIIAFS